MLSTSFKAQYKEKQENGGITSGRDKIDIDVLIDQDLTIEDLEKRKGDNGLYYAVTFAEYPEHFIFSSSALTNMIADAEEAGEDIRGEKIRIREKKKTKNGRWFTPVELI